MWGKKTMWGYFGYDCRFSYGSYKQWRHPHVRELLADFNTCLKEAYKLQEEGKLRILKVYRPSGPWDVDKRYFIYEDDNSDHNHWRFMRARGCGLARGIYDCDPWCEPNQIDDRPDQEEYSKHDEFHRRWEDRLPIEKSERMAQMLKHLEWELQAEQWDRDPDECEAGETYREWATESRRETC